jgi:hypothetical protein
LPSRANKGFSAIVSRGLRANTVHIRNLEDVWGSNDPTLERGGIVVAQCRKHWEMFR